MAKTKAAIPESASESFEEMIADMLRQSGATAAQIRAAERRALAEFKRAGLVPQASRVPCGTPPRRGAARSK